MARLATAITLGPVLGKILKILRRQADGTWKVARQSGATTPFRAAKGHRFLVLAHIGGGVGSGLLSIREKRDRMGLRHWGVQICAQAAIQAQQLDLLWIRMKD